jgi:hypothetical protein
MTDHRQMKDSVPQVAAEIQESDQASNCDEYATLHAIREGLLSLLSEEKESL